MRPSRRAHLGRSDRRHRPRSRPRRRRGCFRPDARGHWSNGPCDRTGDIRLPRAVLIGEYATSAIGRPAGHAAGHRACPCRRALGLGLFGVHGRDACAPLGRLRRGTRPRSGSEDRRGLVLKASQLQSRHTTRRAPLDSHGVPRHQRRAPLIASACVTNCTSCVCRRVCVCVGVVFPCWFALFDALCSVRQVSQCAMSAASSNVVLRCPPLRLRGAIACSHASAASLVPHACRFAGPDLFGSPSRRRSRPVDRAAWSAPTCVGRHLPLQLGAHANSHAPSALIPASAGRRSARRPKRNGHQRNLDAHAHRGGIRLSSVPCEKCLAESTGTVAEQVASAPLRGLREPLLGTAGARHWTAAELQ